MLLFNYLSFLLHICICVYYITLFEFFYWVVLVHFIISSSSCVTSLISLIVHVISSLISKVWIIILDIVSSGLMVIKSLLIIALIVLIHLILNSINVLTVWASLVVVSSLIVILTLIRLLMKIYLRLSIYHIDLLISIYVFHLKLKFIVDFFNFFIKVTILPVAFLLNFNQIIY